MRRRLFGFIATFSLLLCAVTVVFWHRSFSVTDGLTVTDPLTEGTWPPRRSYLWSDGGRVVFTAHSKAGSPVLPSFRYLRHVRHIVYARDEDDEMPVVAGAFVFTRPAFFGFNWSRGSGPGGTFLSLAVPYWALALMFVVLPLIRVGHRLRHQRCRRQTLCQKCGYDLRMTPERCPECGTVPAKPAAG